MSTYVEITEEQTDSGSPIDTDLTRGTAGSDPNGGVRGNFRNLDARVTTLEGSGGGAGSGIAAEERFCAMEKRLSAPGSFSPTEGVCSNFIQPRRPFQARLTKQYTASDATIHYCVNPKFLEAANEDTEYTGFTYTSFQNAANIAADSTNHFIGTEGIGFDKTSGNVLGMVQRDITAAAAISVIGNQTLRLGVYMSSVANIASVNVRLATTTETAVGTNYSQFDVTLQADGSSLAAGKNTLEFDLSTTSSTGGTAWDVTQLIRVIGLGVTTNNSTDTLTGIVFDSIMFEENDNQIGIVKNPRRYISETMELDLLDNTNDNSFVIDSASGFVSGIVTLAATVGTTYSGGSVSRIFRSTLKDENRFAEFNDDSLIASGTTTNKNTWRHQTQLPGGSANNQTIAQSVMHRHEMVFDVIDGQLSSTTLTIYDPADRSSLLPSGATLRRYKKKWSDGQTVLQENGLLTLTSGSTHSSGVTTLTVASTTGIGDDEIVEREGNGTNDDVEVFIDVRATTDNVSYGTKVTPSERLGRYAPIYPGIANVVAHWRLGGSNTYAGTTQIFPGVGQPDLTLNGTINQSGDFVNRTIQSAGPFNASNYFSIAAANSAFLNPNFNVTGKVAFSTWVLRTGAVTGADVLCRRHDTTTQGWYLTFNASNQLALVANTTSNTNTTALSQDVWHHVVVFMHDQTSGASDVNISIWVDGVRQDFTGQSINNISAEFQIGRFDGTNFFDAGRMSDFIVWNNYDITDTDVEIIRAGGYWIDLATGLILNRRFESTGLSGEIIDSKLVLRRAGNALAPTVEAYLTAKTN